ncbi:MAG: peptide chain release factor N(5)-glutamine methyltransferase [Muribaculaceae bacterium]|nr:peptide chain release factor N(5)-glutamine methyltransferase [Muribaculaceae bacterium]
MQVSEAYAALRRELSALAGSEGEATAMARLIFHALKGWDTTGLVVHAADEVSAFTEERIAEILRRLRGGEPIQYILGEGRFYGLDLKVTPATLIPRQETEELVEWVAEDYRGRKDVRVLDAGTGSGAIALALARNLEFPEVTGLDVSGAALAVARENGARLHARVDWVEADLFCWMPEARSLDVIVSNPPYVMESERSGMERHVLEHEPAGALFVPDDDALRYYRRLAEIGRTGLADEGRIYFEINPLKADELVEMMRGMGYEDVELRRDISGRNRMLRATIGRNAR